MFTGIIHHCGNIERIDSHDQSKGFEIHTQFKHLNPGESISIDGVCFTVTNFDNGNFHIDASPETLSLTTLVRKKVNDKVHLERSMRADDLLGGHFVSGHVDQVAEVVAVKKIDNYLQVTFGGLTREVMPYLVTKGCVAIDGVSLTVNGLTADGFDVMLIPHTLTITHFNQLSVGDKVNIEFDMLAKIIERQLKERTLL